MKLSGPQQIALRRLDTHGGWISSGWKHRTNTLDSLVDRGLAERRMRNYSLNWEWRITEEGHRVAATLGEEQG